MLLHILFNIMYLYNLHFIHCCVAVFYISCIVAVFYYVDCCCLLVSDDVV